MRGVLYCVLFYGGYAIQCCNSYNTSVTCENSDRIWEHNGPHRAMACEKGCCIIRATPRATAGYVDLNVGSRLH